MRVHWSERSLNDLESIRNFISISNPLNADKFVAELFNKADSMLQSFPQSGRKIPEKSNENFREIIHGNYRIMYKVLHKEIRIVTVHHSRRRFVGSEIK
jgi:toxin ParE1/3/4